MPDGSSLRSHDSDRVIRPLRKEASLGLRPGSRSFAGERGYTLAEITTALALVGLILAGVLALLDETIARWRVREAAGSLAVSLRAARAKAILDRIEVAVPFDTVRRSYKLAAGGAAVGVRSGTDLVTGKRYQSVTLPVGVSFVRPDVGNAITLHPPHTGELAAVFSPKGLLRSDATPGFAHVGNPARDVYYRVRVNAVGVAVVERWANGDWR